MRYLILIYENEAEAPSPTDAEMQRWFEYTERLKAAGSHLGGEALQPISTATTVRKRDGKLLTTDGPFAETKEQLGGFFLVEARDLNEAIRLASGWPSARIGTVEVRPVEAGLREDGRYEAL